VEVPLTSACKKILLLAAEEADKLGQHHVGTEHLLLGILGVSDSLAARLLTARGATAEAIRKQMPKGVFDSTSQRPGDAMLALEIFLSSLRLNDPSQLASMFATKGLFVDAWGKAWCREEIHKEFASLLAPYAKKNVTLTIEQTLVETAELVVATVLLKNAMHTVGQRFWIHRMSLVLLPEGDAWAILLAQVTPVEIK
jgi:ATP-dependent Clp protease ATP-binding subunit ClpA